MLCCTVAVDRWMDYLRRAASSCRCGYREGRVNVSFRMDYTLHAARRHGSFSLHDRVAEFGMDETSQRTVATAKRHVSGSFSSSLFSSHEPQVGGVEEYPRCFHSVPVFCPWGERFSSNSSTSLFLQIPNRCVIPLPTRSGASAVTMMCV